MTFDVRAVDLAALNSLTKYPAIPTYHELDPSNGRLLETAVPFAGEVVGTEKIDGTNARIVSLPDGSYLLGSREELLYAKGDLIGNPAQGIVAALRPVADRLERGPADAVRVHFLEVYGGKVTAGSKQYTGERRVGFRLFDVATIDGYEDALTWPVESISGWRDAGGQPYASERELQAIAARDELELTPRLFTVDAGELPTGLDTTRAFLADRLPATLGRLDEGAGGTPEGIVLRTVDRSVIAKARFADYDRTLRRRKAS